MRTDCLVFMRTDFCFWEPKKKKKIQKARLGSGCSLVPIVLRVFKSSFSDNNEKLFHLFFLLFREQKNPKKKKKKKKQKEKEKHLSMFSIWCSPCFPCDFSSNTSSTSNMSTTSLSANTIPRCDSLGFSIKSLLSAEIQGAIRSVFTTLSSLSFDLSWNFYRAFSFHACFFLVTLLSCWENLDFFLGDCKI